MKLSTRPQYLCIGRLYCTLVSLGGLLRIVKGRKFGWARQELARASIFYKSAMLHECNSVIALDVAKAVNDRNNRQRSKFSVNDVLHSGFGLPVYTVN